MKVSICGSFGFFNVGDEAIPDAIVDIGRNLGIPIEPLVVGRYDKPPMPEVIGLAEHDLARRESLRGLPLFMSGGGIIDNNSNAVIFRCDYFLRNDFASSVSLFGVSVEPSVSYSWRCRWRLKRLLRQFHIVYTRDELSQLTLNQILPSIKIETIGDLVLWLKPDADALPPLMEIPKRYIAINLAQRWSNDPNWRRWISNELCMLARNLNAPLLFIPMTAEFDDDRVEHRVIADIIRSISPEIRQVTIDVPLKPRAAAAVFARAELVVSMRLHGCVMAFAQETPCVGLGYHPKLFGFFDTVGLRDFLLPKVAPRRQGKEVYGYSFRDLKLEEGELLRTALRSLARRNFSMLPVLKRRSASAFLEILKKDNRSALSAR